MIGKSQHRGNVKERVAVKDTHLVYRACTTSFAEALGFESPDLVIGRTDFDLFPQDLANQQHEIDSKVVGSALSDIGSLQTGTGNSRQIILRDPILSQQGQVHGIDIRLLDGPEPSSSGRPDYRTLVDHGLQGTLVLRDGAALFMNPTAAEIFGVDDTESGVAELNLSSYFAPQDWERLIRRIKAGAQASQQNMPARMLVNINTSHRRKLLMVNIDWIRWQGMPAAMLSLVDLSGQSQQKAAALQTGTSTGSTRAAPPPTVVGMNPLDSGNDSPEFNQVTQRFRDYARASADFFWETDENLCFTMVSPEIETVLGVKAESLAGSTHQELFARAGDAEDSESWAQHLEMLVAHQPFRDFEFKCRVGDEIKVVRYSGVPVYDNNSVFTGYRGSGRDITASTRLAESVAYYANHDALTGLINRRHFESAVSKALETARDDRKSHALFFMDLDNFKIVNDTCGHLAGDELLRQLSSLLSGLIRKSDILARLGGDEFGVLLYNCSVAEALKLGNQVRSEIENFQFLWEENRFMVGVSIGLVVADDRWESLPALFRAADSACYIAKNEGRNQVVVYREADGNTSNRKVETHWVEEINAALEESRIVIARQKILPLANAPTGEQGTGTASTLARLDDDAHFEVLMRLVSPSGELVNPKAFLPSAERYGLSAQLDATVIDVTLNWLKSNPLYLQKVRHCSINLASGSFAKEGFADALLEHIRETGIPPNKLCFELTETATIANLSAASEFMRRLGEIGCRFALDDFGAGLSSFAYLKNLPIDFIKIDGRLVRDIMDDQIDFAMVKAINQVGQALGIQTIAEHVETPLLFQAVREIGVDYAQGMEIEAPAVVQLGRVSQ